MMDLHYLSRASVVGIFGIMLTLAGLLVWGRDDAP